MSLGERLRKALFIETGRGKTTMKVTGVRLPPGTEMLMCSFCKSVIPSLAFHDHGRYHENLMYLEMTGEEGGGG